MKIYIYSLICVFSLVSIKAKELIRPDVTNTDVLGLFDDFELPGLRKHKNLEVALVPAMMSAQTDLESHFLPAIIRLYKYRKTEFLELLWWKTDNSIKRVIILSCYYATSPENGDRRKIETWPRFSSHIHRFKSDEKELRYKELEYVEKNEEKLRKILLDLLE